MSSQDKIQRAILPIPDEQYVGLTTYDAKDRRRARRCLPGAITIR